MEINGIDYEIVPKTATRRGYIRKKPDRSNPSVKQLKNMHLFGKSAFDSFGEKENGDLPTAAIAVQKAFEELKDSQFKENYLAVLEEQKHRISLEDIKFENGLEVVKFLQLSL